jgi:hypothetical protein
LAVSVDTIFVIPRCDIEREEETTEMAKCQPVRNTDSYDKLRLHDTMYYVEVTGRRLRGRMRQKMLTSSKFRRLNDAVTVDVQTGEKSELKHLTTGGDGRVQERKRFNSEWVCPWI